MAAYPCQIGGHRYPGPQRSAYVTRLNGSRPESRKLRLCPRHFAEVLETSRVFMAPILEDSQMSMLCEVGDCQVERKTTLFLKTFDQNEDPKEFAVDVCARHEQALVESLHWDMAISM